VLNLAVMGGGTKVDPAGPVTCHARRAAGDVLLVTSSMLLVTPAARLVDHAITPARTSAPFGTMMMPLRM
jgi:hypothetical protein